ncbi:MAG: hypothetical protein LIO42_05105 [Oscillospiraceae bacterium]|nr:hypothetical protein [Oscillospiraceae bacterium]
MEIKVNKTVVKALLIMAAAAVLIGAALFALQQWENRQQSQSDTLQDSANLTRMARQRQYLLALYKQVASAAESDSNFLLNALVEISEYMVSDCTVNQLSEMTDLLGQLEEEEILELEGEAGQGTEYMEFYPDEDQLQALVIQLFYTPVET